MTMRDVVMLVLAMPDEPVLAGLRCTRPAPPGLRDPEVLKRDLARRYVAWQMHDRAVARVPSESCVVSPARRHIALVKSTKARRA